jgi:two-component sensor histidine kinase
LLGSLLLSGFFFQETASRFRQRQQAERYLASLDSLNEISTAISARLGSEHEMMERLAESSGQLLGMACSNISFLDTETQLFKIYTIAGPQTDRRCKDFDLNRIPEARECQNTGEVTFIEEITREKITGTIRIPVDPLVGAMILIPLQVEGTRVGVMGLFHPEPRRFSDAERRLARLLGSQASVILANSRLYTQTQQTLELHQELLEQTRRDAETKSILLRELNHRVKNNLAGIVGLLSMDEANLTPDAREWLDRVIERIRTMARAHELFTSGINHVGLPQLLEQVLPSLSVLLTPGMVVRTNIEGVTMQLETQQAVTLAMVLHELCSNAIVHGLVERGTVTISARNNENGVLLEVTDDGHGLPNDMEPGPLDEITPLESQDSTASDDSGINQSAPTSIVVQSHGIGLKLVSALVKRELQGVFQLCRGLEGGTVASVQLPPVRK